jgi:type I restriction enzyme, S subunit
VRDVSFEDVFEFANGRELMENSKNGVFQVYGSNGVIGSSLTSNHEKGIIIGRVGAYCGSVYICENKFWATDNTIVLYPKNGQNLRYWYYFLRTLNLNAVAGGAAQPLITHKILKPITAEIHLPFEQQAIADFLSHFDALIENYTRQITLLEQAARLIYSEWFVRLRFPGHEKIRVVDGVPDGWRNKTLGDVTVLNPDAISDQFAWDTLTYVDISCVSQGKIDSSTDYRLPDAPGRARRLVNDGDVIWSCVRPNRRSYALIAKPSPNLVVSTGFCVIRPRVIASSFLYCLVTTDEFVGHLERNAQGAAYPAVNPKDFASFKIVLPQPSVIDAFDEVAKPIFAQIENLSLQSKQLRLARDMLLPKLISGQIRL